MKGLLKKALALLLCAVALLTFAVPTWAYRAIDTGKKGSMTVDYVYKDGEKAIHIPNATFRLYRVADVTKYVRFEVVAPFSGYPVDLTAENVEEWNKIATELADYAVDGKAEPVKTGKTDADGKLAWEDLETGLYLLVGDKCVYEKYTYTPDPAVVMLPSLDPTTDEWHYDVTVSPKVERKAVPDEPEDETLTRKVLKKWVDNDSTDRPKEVTVKLMKDKAQYALVKLSAENKWSYEWKDLPAYDKNGAEIDWSIIEEGVSGYTTKIEKSGVTFVVTNTKNGVTPNPKPKPKDDPDLPHTGVTWWPVPVLFFMGSLCVLVGIARRKNAEE